MVDIIEMYIYWNSPKVYSKSTIELLEAGIGSNYNGTSTCEHECRRGAGVIEYFFELQI